MRAIEALSAALIEWGLSTPPSLEDFSPLLQNFELWVRLSGQVVAATSCSIIDSEWCTDQLPSLCQRPCILLFCFPETSREGQCCLSATLKNG